MKKIVLATAALLAVSSAAFAASDNYGSKSVDQPAATVDTAPTASIRSNSAVYKLLNSSSDEHKPVQQGSDRNLFGR